MSGSHRDTPALPIEPLSSVGPSAARQSDSPHPGTMAINDMNRHLVLLLGHIEGVLERRQVLVVGILSVLSIVGYLCKAASTPMWADELWTFYLAKAPDTGTILRAIKQGMELNPPLSFLLAHASQLVFGASEVGTRLPSLLSFWLMSLALFLFMKRRAGAISGYVAMLLPYFTYAEAHAAEARAYSQVLCAGALALLFWQIGEKPAPAKYAMPGFAVAIAALVSLHYFALYIVVAIALAELVRPDKNRTRTMWFWGSLAAGCTPFLYLIPVMRNVRAGAGHFLLSPSPEALNAAYSDAAGPAAAIAVFLIGLAARPVVERFTAPAGEQRSALALHEWTAAILLSLMPPAMYVAAITITNAYVGRYVMPVILGIVILTSALVYRIGTAVREIPVLLACILSVGFSGRQINNVLTWVKAPPLRAEGEWRTLPFPNLPVVIDDDNQFLQTARYGTPQMVARSYYLTDTELEIRKVGYDTIGRTMQVGRTLHPLHVEDYRKFVSEHRQFLLIRNSNLMVGWVPKQLMMDRADLRLIGFRKGYGFRADEGSIFLVTMQANSPAGGPGLTPNAH